MSAWLTHVDEHAPWAGVTSPDCSYCRRAARRAVYQDVQRRMARRPDGGSFDDEEEVTQPDAQPLAALAAQVRR